MARHEEFLLGNAALHLQLSNALAVMTQLICNASKPPSAQQLSEAMNMPLRYLRKLLRTLGTGGLLKQHERLQDTWVCAREPHMISLADIYHCLMDHRLMAEKEESSEPFAATSANGVTSSADLLMMQATMSVNQIVLQHLQQFDLGRLKVAESAMLFTASLRERALSGYGVAMPHLDESAVTN